MNRKSSRSATPKPPAAPTFGQLYREHLSIHGSLLLAEATIMLFLFLPPTAVAFGIN
jgi:hypothetical protein